MTKKKVPPVLRRIAGGIVLLLGIVGLFLPVLQGILLIALGLYLLGIQPPRWIRERLPKSRSVSVPTTDPSHSPPQDSPPVADDSTAEEASPGNGRPSP